MIQSCSNTFPSPLPDVNMEFSYAIQDAGSNPAFFMSFYIRNKPLDVNPATCIPNTINLINLATSNLFTVTIRQPNLQN